MTWLKSLCDGDKYVGDLGPASLAPPVALPREQWPDPAVGQVWRTNAENWEGTLIGPRLSGAPGWRIQRKDGTVGAFGPSSWTNGEMEYVGPGTWKPEAAKPATCCTRPCVSSFSCAMSQPDGATGGKCCMCECHMAVDADVDAAVATLAPPLMSESAIFGAMKARDKARTAVEMFPEVPDRQPRQSVNMLTGGVWSLRK